MLSGFSSRAIVETVLPKQVMTDQPTNRDESWQPCPPGDLQRLATGIRRRRKWEHRKQVVTTAGAVLVAVAGVVLVTTYTQNVQQPVSGDRYYAGISCTDVRKKMPEMMMGKVDEQQMMQIEEHLKQCQSCRETRERMNMKMSVLPTHETEDPHSSRKMLAYLDWTPPPRTGR